MKKLAAGCLVVLVLCAVAAGIGAFWLLRSARPLVERAGQTMDAIANLGRARDIEATVEATGTFTPPGSGELTEAQVGQFLEVQRHVNVRLGSGVDRLKAKYAELSTPGMQRVDYRRFLAALGDLSDVYLDGKRAQAEALNAAHLSLDEFRWVRLRVYAAAGVEVTDVQLDALERLLKESGARLPEGTSSADLPVPERNRALVKPYVAEIKSWVPLTLIGL